MRIDLTCEKIASLARDQWEGMSQEKRAEEEALSLRLITARTRGNLSRDDLIAIATWKWRGGRTRQLVSENLNNDIEEATRISLSTRSERLRAGALLSLRGVHWPMASVILHFTHSDPYPILDVRAMNTVGGDAFYNYEKWMKYVDICRTKAAECRISMRTLDRALWQSDLSPET